MAFQGCGIFSSITSLPTAATKAPSALIPLCGGTLWFSELFKSLGSYCVSVSVCVHLLYSYPTHCSLGWLWLSLASEVSGCVLPPE